MNPEIVSRCRVDDQLPHRDATVLVVDDDEALADTFALWLEDLVDVRTAYATDDALDVLADATVDVVLLDRRMPTMSGDELLAVLRDRGDDPRVAMVSAIEPIGDLLELPVDDYLVKPVDRDALVNTVSNLLWRAGQPPAVREYLALEAKLATLEGRTESHGFDDAEALATLRDHAARARERARAALERDHSDDDHTATDAT